MDEGEAAPVAEDMHWGSGELGTEWDTWSVEPSKRGRGEEGKDREVGALTNKPTTWRKDEGENWSIVGTFDTGAFTTIFTKNMVPGMKVEKTANSSLVEMSWALKGRQNCRAQQGTTPH